MSHRISRLEPEFVDSFPSTMQPGVLYVSILYRTCGHLCCCGCGEEVVTPLSPARWAFTYDGRTASLSPSVGNWSLPCRSHYWISNDRIHWSRRYSAGEITSNRADDKAALKAEIAHERQPPRPRWLQWLTRGCLPHE